MMATPWDNLLIGIAIGVVVVFFLGAIAFGLIARRQKRTDERDYDEQQGWGA